MVFPNTLITSNKKMGTAAPPAGNSPLAHFRILSLRPSWAKYAGHSTKEGLTSGIHLSALNPFGDFLGMQDMCQGMSFWNKSFRTETYSVTVTDQMAFLFV